MLTGARRGVQEIDKAVVELCPAWNHKPAIMLAYKAADRDKAGTVDKAEFCRLLHYLSYFSDLWEHFDQLVGRGRASLDDF
jgi:uncharacterized phage-associated protein